MHQHRSLAISFRKHLCLSLSPSSQPIILLNTLEKLIEKVICERLQFQLISINFIYHNQLEGLKQCLTTNTSIFLMYLIYLGWVKGPQMSTLAFYITQFFPLLNHQLLSLILDKASFDPRIFSFFSNYLIGRKTQYLWNNFFPSLFNIDVGVEQGSILSLILSAFYISPIFHIFEKRSKNLNIPISSLSFVNNELLILQEKSFEKTNAFLYCSYNIISFLLNQFGLVIEHGKSKVFHFSRSYEIFNSSSLDLSL